MASLRDILKARLTKYVIKDAQSKMAKGKTYSIIVADDQTIPILDHCFKIHELNDLDIGVVVNIKYNRERVKISPIYFLSPTTESVNALVADYANAKETRYASPVHVYFISTVSKSIIDTVKKSNLKAILGSFSEIHCNFLVLEQRVFKFKSPYNDKNDNGSEVFKRLYVDQKSRSDELDEQSKQLVSICLTLNEHPYIRFSGTSRLSQQLAGLFDKNFGDIKNNLKNFSPNENRATLLILDRADDPLTPLLHELTYQTMLMDLLNEKINLDKNTIEFASDDEKQAKASKPLPNEQDKLWTQYRHTFFGDVIQEIPKSFKQWTKENDVLKYQKKKEAKKGKEAEMSSNDMLSAIRGLPQYQTTYNQYKFHLDIASKLSNLFKSLGLQDTIDLEQTIATHIDEDGKKCDATAIQQKISKIITNPDLPKQLKLRLFMMYIIAQGGLDYRQRKQILEQGNLLDDQSHNTIKNLGYLGVILNTNKKSDGHKNQTYWKELQVIAKNKAKGTDLIRYISYLEWIVKNHQEGSLSNDDFPWLRAPAKKVVNNNNNNNNNNNQAQQKAQQKVTTSFRRHKNSVAPNNNNNNNNEKNNEKANVEESNNSKLIIYMLGGISYNELKTCYQFSASLGVDIYVGSTAIFNAARYLEILSTDSGNDEEKNDD